MQHATCNMQHTTCNIYIHTINIQETDMLDPVLLDELISNIGTLSSVYHKPPSAFTESRFVPVGEYKHKQLFK